MAEFTVRLGTPAGEIVTRTVEALAANEARVRLEREGFKVFAITAPKGEGVASLTRLGAAGGRVRV
jgi:type IV pilus assembly protein PilC